MTGTLQTMRDTLLYECRIKLVRYRSEICINGGKWTDLHECYNYDSGALERQDEYGVNEGYDCRNHAGREDYHQPGS